MVKLSKADARFLKTHGIDLADVFDGSHMTTREIRVEMKASGKIIAFGKPCLYGHRIRAAGGCVRCDPSRISFALRSRKPGYVYLAHSKNGRLAKIGSSTDPHNRIKIANYEGWGGQRDWELVMVTASHASGREERKVQGMVQHLSISLNWERNGISQITKEAFEWDFDALINAMVQGCENYPELIF